MRFPALARPVRAHQSDHGAASGKRWSAGTALMVVAVLSALLTACQNPLPQRRIDLKVLVLNDGSVGVSAIRDELKLEGVPYREVDLTSATRPVVNDAFLSIKTAQPNQERAYYQSVVLPNEAPTQLAAAELTALRAFESKFAIREVNAYTWANPAVGLNYAEAPNGFIGALDNMTGTVTAAGKTSGFDYLAGAVPFEVGSYGYAATPLATQAAGASFTPLVTVPIPGSSAGGSILGVHTQNGREALVITSSFSVRQEQFRLLGTGIVNWMTRGVHLGHDRKYFTVHVDDLFAADDRWNSAANCTFDEDCPPNVPELPKIRMTAADLATVVAWQQANNFTFEMAWNGKASDDWIEQTGSDPLLAAVKANLNKFTYLNHTFTHLFLGCVQNKTVVPWVCEKNPDGSIRWVPQATIESEINLNKTFAQKHGIPYTASELLTGEHSGLFLLPQQPTDNPNLAPAFAKTGIKVTGSDASRDFNARSIGGTRTVPRYPLNVFFNAASEADTIDEYNWIFTSEADGGSGLCTRNPATMTCLTPINATTGFDDWIVPYDTPQAVRRILGNDPRPHYAHQTNLTEDFTLLQMTESILKRYRSLYTASSPIVTLRETQASAILDQQTSWATGATKVEAYQIGKEVYINANGYTGKVPFTGPAATRVGSATGAAFGEAYAGQRSAWTTVSASVPLRLVLG